MDDELIKYKLNRVKEYFEKRLFIVKDGLKYGCDFILYTDDPSKVHSKYAVLVDRGQNLLNIMAVQRVINTVRKVLIFVYFFNEEIIITKIERFNL